MSGSEPSTAIASPPPLTLLSEDERIFASSVREFADAEIRPHVLQMDEEAAIRPEIVRQCFELGLMGIEVPESYGGAGGSFFLACIAIEALARIDPSVCVLVDVQNTLVNNVLLRWASEEQKRAYLPRLTRDTVGAYALSEAGSGSDAFALRTRAQDRGDHWELTGRKLWISNGQEAGIFVLFATVDPDLGYKGITAFLVERDFPGFTVGRKEDKLGLRASSTTELVLESCRVPKANVIGEIGKGYRIAIETLNEGRIGIGAQSVGMAQGALDAAVAYTQEREQFGQPIAKFQGVQFQIADAATQLEASRLMVYNAARLKDAGRPFIREAAMAKLFASVAAERIASQAVDLFGGNGVVREYPVEKLYRDARVVQIYEGTSNMQRQTIARTLLG
ncbi:MAG TPA: acyl-CoA dehydrogenase [Thermoanaerobaculia bacterium]|nr:acyl-CoA dehydrogenase [Thermoanaerobaculia bacterium]